MAFGRKEVKESDAEKSDVGKPTEAEAARREVKVPANVVPLGKVEKGNVTPAGLVLKVGE